MSGQISVSVMCANALQLREDLKSYERNGIEYVHIDVMDNAFVPNLMLPPCWIKDLHKETHIPFDYHLMMYHPESVIPELGLRKGDIVSIHMEATPHLQRVMQQVKEQGGKAAVALNPSTPIVLLEDVLPDADMVLLMTVNPGFAGQKMVGQCLDKISRLRRFLDERGFAHIPIEVDGNCSFENSRLMRQAGADIFVAGTSSVYTKSMSFDDACSQLRQNIA